MKCPNCGHSFARERKQRSTYKERPGKLDRYMSGYESYRRSWLAAQAKPQTYILMKMEPTTNAK